MDEFFKLVETAGKSIISGEQIDGNVISGIKKITSKSGYIGVAQINTCPGNIEYNANKIAEYIKFAELVSLESVIFPEMSLIGYPLQDTVSRYPILIEDNIKWLEGLAKLTKKTMALVGFLEPTEEKDKYYNSIAILQNGKIQDIVRKNISASFSQYHDFNYQKPFNQLKINNNYCITIGDDFYNDYIIEQISKQKPNIIINCSVAALNKYQEYIKNLQLSNISSKIGIPLIYVNQSGANDNFLFNGASCIYNSEGKIIAQAKAYDEQLLIVNPYNNTGKLYELPNEFSAANKSENFSLDYDNDMERVYNALLQGVKDYFKKCGLKRAVLGLSGGLDSTVCAVILADALGRENVYGVSMPSHITTKESISDAEQLANNLGINFVEAPIRSMIDTTSDALNNLFEKVESKWNCRYKKSFTLDNIQARSRAMFLWGVSNEFPSCIPIATSDKSEAYMGYATINGDMSGGFAPIADITKTKLFALARWLNKNRAEKNVIPESVILKRPGAELAINPKTGKPLIAEDALMPYEFLDEIIWRIENLQQSYNDLLNTKFVYEMNNSVSKEQKAEWLDKFYKRMSTAFYKWSIMPPSVIVEPHSINKGDYVQPITSSGINYKGVSDDYVTKSLNRNLSV